MRVTRTVNGRTVSENDLKSLVIAAPAALRAVDAAKRRAPK